MARGRKTPKPKKRKTLHGRKWLVIVFVSLLLVPGLEVAAVRFINPPWTRPMLLQQGGDMFSRGEGTPLRYRWADLREVPEMFLKHLWISASRRAVLRGSSRRCWRPVLPNPKRWNPAKPGPTLRRRQGRILLREQSAEFPGQLVR